MSIEQLLNKNIDRRQFLKETGKAAAGLAGLLSGCAPTLKETRQDVAQINWDCNLILPIPPVGCYTGTNLQRGSDIIGEYYKKYYNITPTFHAIGFGKYAASNNFFPKLFSELAIEHGIIPVIRYVIMPFNGYEPIIKGEHDDTIREFAGECAKFESAIVLIPFQHPNEPNSKHFKWGGYPASQYVEAWVRMHGLFEKEGANKNTVWATKSKMGHWTNFSYPDPFPYCPPKEYIDIIGWACNDHNKPEIGLYSQSLISFFDSYYKRAAKKYSRKPQMFWELSAAKGKYQHKWLDDALNDIKNTYVRVKGVMLDEQYYSGIGDAYGDFNPDLTSDSTKVIKKHFASGYFIGSAVRKA